MMLWLGSLCNNLILQPNHTTPLDDVAPRQGQTQLCMKVFVQRDYSEGTTVRFQTHFPAELEGKVSHSKSF